MAEYRTRMKIIGDILSTTQDELQDENGASVTYLIRKANISHSRISRILKTIDILDENLAFFSEIFKISKNLKQ